MIDFAPILKIIPIFFVALASPGPDFMLISSLAMSRGRGAGILGAIGIAAGVVIYVMLCVFGLAIFLAQLAWLSMIIKVLGGLYLIYLGYQLWKASLAPQTGAAPVIGKKKNPFVMGFVTNMTNPKALAFFTSIFALVLTPHTSLATQGAIIGTMTLMTAGWFSFVSVVLSTPALRKVYVHLGKWIDRVAGTVLAFFGLRLLFSARS